MSHDQFQRTLAHSGWISACPTLHILVSLITLKTTLWVHLEFWQRTYQSVQSMKHMNKNLQLILPVRFLTIPKKIYTEQLHAVKQNIYICFLLRAPHSCKHHGLWPCTTGSHTLYAIIDLCWVLHIKRPFWDHLHRQFAYITTGTVYANQPYNCTNDYGSRPCPFKSWT